MSVKKVYVKKLVCKGVNIEEVCYNECWSCFRYESDDRLVLSMKVMIF